MSTAQDPHILLRLASDFRDSLAVKHCYGLDNFEQLISPAIGPVTEAFPKAQFAFYAHADQSDLFKINVHQSIDDFALIYDQLIREKKLQICHGDESYTLIRRGLKPLGLLYIQSKIQLNDFANILAGLSAHALHQWQKSREVISAHYGKVGLTEFRPKSIIGNSKPMLKVYSLMEKVLNSSATVLILGESGSGKEKIAQELHAHSSRKNKPIISVNCAAMPTDLIESELFGHVKGAFTSASSDRPGRFELANNGTLFLDEIGDLPLASQTKLLRALQEKTVERVGSSKPIHCDVRIVAATNQDLKRLVEEGKFRQDLYFRLDVFPIHIPALRERGNDILMLADFFINQYNRQYDKEIKRLSTSAIDMLMRYHWPGNVRELSNIIERAVLLSDERVLQGHHLPASLQTPESTNTRFSGQLESHLEQVERDLIIDGLKSYDGNISQTAKALGTTERKIGLRIKKFMIEPKRFKKKSYQNVDFEGKSTIS